MKNAESFLMDDYLKEKQIIASLFLQQVAKNHQKPAVADDQTDITYEQLAGIAGVVARKIIEKTGNDSARICILAPQNIYAVAGILGVLMSGKCFVPMLPQENDNYLRYLWENSEASLIVCSPKDATRAVSICGDSQNVITCERVCGRADIFASSGYSNKQEIISAIMYTSGTTGQPKGVMTTESAILNRALQHVEMAGVTSHDRQVAVVPWQFSSSFPDIFAPLITGATIHMYDIHRQGIEKLGHWIKKNEITLLKLPAALVRRFAQSVSADMVRAVRYIHCGGGTRVNDAKNLLDIFSDNVVLMHGFASTETNLVTAGEWRRSDQIFEDKNAPYIMPAGYPVAGKNIQIVDEERNSVALGREGELAVISRDIFHGYWKQPEMTQQCLKELPDGERAFYTSDLGRIREDGGLEIIGRKGQRVKIRSLRIDLGAVESLLYSLPYVKDAAAITVSSANQDAQLVAYLEITSNDIVTTTRLREDLQQITPDYTIPSRFVVMESLPRTASGKINRKFLPAPDRQRPLLANPYVPPRTPLEKKLAGVWADVLELDKVGIHDQFVELGGDSLLILEMLVNLEHALGNKIQVDRLLHVFTIAQMAELIENQDIQQGLISDIKLSWRWRIKYFRRRLKRGDFYAPLWVQPFLPSFKFFLFLHKLWISLPVSRFLLRKKISIFEQWLALTGQADRSGELTRQYLMANTWVIARNILIMKKRMIDQWVSIKGWEHLEKAAAANRGVILVFPHQHIFLRYMREELILRLFPKSYHLKQTGLPMENALKTVGLAKRLQEAREVLTRGGVVLVAGDGQQGNEKIVLVRFGRRFPFRAGAAELCVQNGAPLIPIFPSLRSDGGVELEFFAPLTSQDGNSRSAQVEDIVRQYAQIYVVRWPQMLPYISKGHLRKRLRDLPQP